MKSSLRKPVQSSAGSKPNAALGVFADGEDACARQTVRDGVGGKSPVAISRQTVPGPHPKVALPVLINVQHSFAGQPVLHSEALESAIAEAACAPVKGADPELPRTVFTKRANIVRLQARIVFHLKNREFDSIEPGQAVARAHPNIALSGLGDGLHRSLWKTISFTPDILVVLGNGGGRVESKRPLREDRNRQRQTKPDRQGVHGYSRTLSAVGRLSKHILRPHRSEDKILHFLCFLGVQTRHAPTLRKSCHLEPGGCRFSH